ncbi:MAG TPA: hypothetical protein VE988_28375 [Gemmataceae bacterium]|nr:hypothetical protein [Gemmataceae bacterium]
MPVEVERRRILLAARPPEAKELHTLFADPCLDRWDILDADSFERARFLLQHNPCDILLVDESLYHSAGRAGLAWLARRQDPQTVFLTGMDPDTIALAYELGVSLCVPRRMSLDNPRVLAAALQRAVAITDLQMGQRRTADRLLTCRRQVDRLVNLLWRTIPMDSDHQWFSHRHVLERLQEEVARSGRHGTTFTVALGEMEFDAAEKPEALEPTDWMSSAVANAKRRCDVAGHYGMRGFMLLMMQTPPAGGMTCCRRLQTRLQEMAMRQMGASGPVRACFGLSSFTPENATTGSLLSRAEKHLEAAKAGVSDGIVAG